MYTLYSIPRMVIGAVRLFYIVQLLAEEIHNNCWIALLMPT